MARGLIAVILDVFAIGSRNNCDDVLVNVLEATLMMDLGEASRGEVI